jgi:hypothetical protein
VLRDRDTLIVASLSVLMWLGICWVLGGLGPLTWIVAVLLFAGGIWAHVGRDNPPDAEPSARPPVAPRSRRKKRRRWIYGPPSE